MKFTEEQMALIDKNLKIGKCPNCGSEEKKYIFPEIINLTSHEEGDVEQDKYDAIVAQCPHCGFLLFFSKQFILNKQEE